jgi:hypothetical protein
VAKRCSPLKDEDGELAGEKEAAVTRIGDGGSAVLRRRIGAWAPLCGRCRRRRRRPGAKNTR